MRTKFDIYVFIKFTQKLYMVIIENIRLASHLWCCLFKFMASIFFGTLLFDQFPVTLNITGYLNSVSLNRDVGQLFNQSFPRILWLDNYRSIFFFFFSFLYFCFCLFMCMWFFFGGGGLFLFLSWQFLYTLYLIDDWLMFSTNFSSISAPSCRENKLLILNNI